VIDKYAEAFNVNSELREQFRHNPVHWKKNQTNSLVVPSAVLQECSKLVLDPADEVDVATMQTLLDRSTSLFDIQSARQLQSPLRQRDGEFDLS